MAEKNSLGYIIVEGEEGQLRGASLVVDFRGIPMDFRYTEPIRPTRLERILYGNALDVYLKEELILQSLLGAIETKPQLWIANEEALVTPLRQVSKTKTVALFQSKHSPLEAMGNIEPTSDPNSVLVQTDEVSAPLLMVLPINVRPDEIEQVAILLSNAASTMELLEPFNRIQKALVSLSED